MLDSVIAMLTDDLDVVLLDVGGTLIEEAPRGTSVSDLDARPYVGVAETLDALAPTTRLAAVTNTAVMREPDVRRLLDAAGLQHLDVIVTSVDAGAAKPDPAALRLALDRLDATADRALYIGDLDTDQAAARAAGTAFAATDRGVADALERAATSTRGPFARAAARVQPLDPAAASDARARQDQLTKPPGSLGRLEDLGVQLAAIAGTSPPPVAARPAVAVFAADHGVVASGVTPWPQEVTAQMLANFVAGGAAINVIARQVGATVAVVDIGVASDVSALAAVQHRKVRAGTANLADGPAMTIAEARAALDAGVEVAEGLLAQGHDLLATGDMGIGNTTASAALIASLTGRDAATVTGRGTGIDDGMLAAKTAIVDGATRRAARYLDPVSVLSELGGLEIAALAGFVVAGAAGGVPVIVDGVIALAALLVADALAPGVADRCVAGHRSTEPGATAALEHLRLTPLLDLGLRLGEGTGACLAVPLVQTAARVLREMATFAEAAVSDDPIIPD
ncbi:MAG TPA: nicotinate-nucleotide--dimethylbenzimidazole phosphoribosyltransferase [Acidimicrobiia bacterium]|nr:nicotinate-nucleotide--dimethylbenzimidazole phosphoribosyltransferase [Acidimicrobiia bacterium]